MYSIPERRSVFSFSTLKKLCEHLVHLVIACTLQLTLVAFVVCLFYFCIKYTDIFSVAEIIWSLPILLFFPFINFLSKHVNKMSERIVIISMISAEILISFIMIVSYDTQPCSDYAIIWKGANEIAQGTFTAGITPSDYMYYYNWQLGITVLESLPIRLGFSFFGLKFINAALLISIQYIEYCLVKYKLGRQTACSAYLLATFFLPWCLTIPQFTNHHICLTLLLLTLHLLDQPYRLRWSCAGILLAFINVLRPLGIIVILAAICYSIYLIIQKHSLQPLIPLICFLFTYTLFLTCFDNTFIQLGYTDAPVSKARIPYFKFQKGLYGYSNPSTDLSVFAYDYDAYNAAMQQELLDHLLTRPLDTLIFVANKMVRYLGLFDYQFEMTYNHDVTFYTQYPVRALYSLSWFQYIGICLFALRGYRIYRNRHPVDIDQIFFIGNTLVYFFIEAFSSYRFESYPFLIMLAALGLEQPLQFTQINRHAGVGITDKSLQISGSHT